MKVAGLEQSFREYAYVLKALKFGDHDPQPTPLYHSSRKVNSYL
jgi:hypothetical protein